MKSFLTQYIAEYSHPRILESGYGNHGFAPHAPALTIPSVRTGDIPSAQKGNVCVFREKDTRQTLCEYSGLEEHIIGSWRGIPCVLVDNHNHVLYWWYAAYVSGMIERGSHVIHFDEHSDMWENTNSLDVATYSDPSRLWGFVNECCTVANYIQPALREGLIQTVVRIEGEYDLEKLNTEKPNGHSIVNIDLDFFSPELDYIPETLKIQKIHKSMIHASLITIATSPFFIDHDRAIKKLRKIFDVSQ